MKRKIVGVLGRALCWMYWMLFAAASPGAVNVELKVFVCATKGSSHLNLRFSITDMMAKFGRSN